MDYGLRSGPFLIHLTTSLELVAAGIERFYSRFLFTPGRGFYDFHIRIDSPFGFRRWFRPQAHFLIDGKSPFKPLPVKQAYPLFEWGLNWCISHHAHQYLILHAAVVAREGRAIVMPGRAGVGKSTLCAALVQRGWHLLSDELALISLENGSLTSLARPICLKNGAIEVMREFAPGADYGPVVNDTQKGRIAHMGIPESTFEQVDAAAIPAWLIFPRYDNSRQCEVTACGKGSAFLDAAGQGINYSLLGAAGFKALQGLVDRCRCFEFVFSDLDQAVAGINRVTCSIHAIGK